MTLVGPHHSAAIHALQAYVESQPSVDADAIVWLQGDRFDRGAVALALYQQGRAPRILLTGNNELVGESTRPGETNVRIDAMANWLIERGVPASAIEQDSQSMHTRDQAVFAVDRALREAWSTLIVVASRHHLLRAYLTFLQRCDEAGWAGRLVPAHDGIDADATPAGRSLSARDVFESEVEKIQRYAAHVFAPERALARLESDAQGLQITLLCDTPASWIVPFAERLRGLLIADGHRARLIHDADALPEGDLAVLLGCERIVSSAHRARNRWTLVVHESDLPKGRGWSPLTWLVLEGAHRIPVTLLEAHDEVDAGDIYLQRWIELEGTELNAELKQAQGEATIALVREFAERHAELGPTPQRGEATWYARRRPKDSELDPHKSLAEQFELLRVVDNERYPAFFTHRGRRYTLRIEAEPSDAGESSAAASRDGRGAAPESS